MNIKSTYQTAPLLFTNKKSGLSLLYQNRYKWASKRENLSLGLPIKWDSNHSAQLQGLEYRNFSCSKGSHNTFYKANKKGADQTARMHSLVSTFIVCIKQSQAFKRRGPYNNKKQSLTWTICAFCLFLQACCSTKGSDGTHLKIMTCLCGAVISLSADVCSVVIDAVVPLWAVIT